MFISREKFSLHIADSSRLLPSYEEINKKWVNGSVSRVDDCSDLSSVLLTQDSRRFSKFRASTIKLLIHI